MRPRAGSTRCSLCLTSAIQVGMLRPQLRQSQDKSPDSGPTSHSGDCSFHYTLLAPDSLLCLRPWEADGAGRLDEQQMGRKPHRAESVGNAQVLKHMGQGWSFGSATPSEPLKTPLPVLENEDHQYPSTKSFMWVTPPTPTRRSGSGFGVFSNNLLLRQEWWRQEAGRPCGLTEVTLFTRLPSELRPGKGGLCCEPQGRPWPVPPLRQLAAKCARPSAAVFHRWGR